MLSSNRAKQVGYQSIWTYHTINKEETCCNCLQFKLCHIHLLHYFWANCFPGNTYIFLAKRPITAEKRHSYCLWHCTWNFSPCVRLCPENKILWFCMGIQQCLRVLSMNPQQFCKVLPASYIASANDCTSIQFWSRTSSKWWKQF